MNLMCNIAHMNTTEYTLPTISDSLPYRTQSVLVAYLLAMQYDVASDYVAENREEKVLAQFGAIIKVLNETWAREDATKVCRDCDYCGTSKGHDDKISE